MNTAPILVRALSLAALAGTAAVRLAARLAAAALGASGEPRGSTVGRTLAELFRAAGPAYVKLGQLLSTRRDLFGDEAIQHLAQLQDRLPPVPLAAVAKRFRAELGVELPEVFARVDPVPVGSASIATVYGATLRDGRAVAVKVRRGGVAERIGTDLRLLRAGAALLARLPPFRLIPVTAIVEDLCVSLERQLDFPREAAAARRMREALRYEAGVRVPELVDELCAPSILTMELMEGRTFRRPAGAQERGAAVALLCALYRMIFVEGLIHCDLHHGNLRLLSDGRLALLDFGFTAEIAGSDRLAFAKFFYALSTGQGAVCARIAVEMADPPRAGFAYPPFAREIEALVERTAGLPASEFRVAPFVAALFGIQRAHGLRSTSAFVMPILALLSVEGVVNELHPEVDFQAEARPYVFRASISGTAGATFPSPTAADASRSYSPRRLIPSSLAAAALFPPETRRASER